MINPPNPIQSGVRTAFDKITENVKNVDLNADLKEITSEAKFRNPLKSADSY